jgi:hypothetical protein
MISKLEELWKQEELSELSEPRDTASMVRECGQPTGIPTGGDKVR